MKTTTISALEAHISAELRKVSKGGRVVISDRDTSIAQVAPYETGQVATISVRAPDSVPFVVPRASFRIQHDPIDYLLEDRSRR